MSKLDNILYIGPYREFSGMGNASRAYLKALYRTGHNISIRPIYNIYKEYPEENIDNELLELETNFSKKYHTIIQHSYPHQFCFNNNFDKHVGIIHLDSFGYKSNIIQYLKTMDKIIVGSKFVASQIKGFTDINVSIIPEPIDIEEIENYRNNNKKKETKTYSFYCIGDWVSRKNFEKIVFAYLKISARYSNIDLVIKTKSFLDSDTDTKNKIEYTLSKAYSLFKNIPIKKPKIVIGEINKDNMYYIHNNNDCLISLSGGESFGYSLLEALSFNNNIILNSRSAPYEFCNLKETETLTVDTESSMCLDDSQIFPIYNSMMQNWDYPVENSIIENMEKAINETEEIRLKRIGEQNSIKKLFSVENISKLMEII